MAKKSYGKPLVIDLSIEGVTGIGARSCNNVGPDFSNGACGGGWGYTGVCTLGITPTFGCTNGSVPNYQGGLCKNGIATVGTCNNGTDVTGSHSLCVRGSNASYVCNTGSSAQYTGGDPEFCDFGNAQPPISSS